jgi:hypothetical protein
VLDDESVGIAEIRALMVLAAALRRIASSLAKNSLIDALVDAREYALLGNCGRHLPAGRARSSKYDDTAADAADESGERQATCQDFSAGCRCFWGV